MWLVYFLQHVQLLTQVYMLSCTQTWLRDETHQCKQYVEELAVFHDKAVLNSNEIFGSLSAELSMFCTPGISDAYRYFNKRLYADLISLLLESLVVFLIMSVFSVILIFINSLLYTLKEENFKANSENVCVLDEKIQFCLTKL